MLISIVIYNFQIDKNKKTGVLGDKSVFLQSSGINLCHIQARDGATLLISSKLINLEN